MKIREIRLRNFKRFSDTNITDIPIAARVVLLVGPNGCGKSSLIDSVHWWHRRNWSGTGNPWDDTYHRKQIPGTAANQGNAVSLVFHDPQPAGDADRRKLGISK